MEQQIYFTTNFQILVLEVVIKEEERHTHNFILVHSIRATSSPTLHQDGFH